MKNRTRIALYAVTALLISGAVPSVWAKDAKPVAKATEVSPTDLPAAVTQSLKSAFPGAVITEAIREVENNVEVYDVETRDGTIERDLIFSLDGRLLEAGEHISPSALPALVMDAALKAYPGSTITEAERKTINGVERYDVTVKSGGASHELYLSPTGSPLSVTDENDDGEADDGDDD